MRAACVSWPLHAGVVFFFAAQPEMQLATSQAFEGGQCAARACRWPFFWSSLPQFYLSCPSQAFNSIAFFSIVSASAFPRRPLLAFFSLPSGRVHVTLPVEPAHPFVSPVIVNLAAVARRFMQRCFCGGEGGMHMSRLPCNGPSPDSPCNLRVEAGVKGEGGRCPLESCHPIL